MEIAVMEFVPGRDTAVVSGVGAELHQNTVMARPMLLLLQVSILHQHHHWMQASVAVEMLEKACVLIQIIAAVSGDIVDRARATATWWTTELTRMALAGVEVLEMESAGRANAAHSMVIVEKVRSIVLVMLTKEMSPKLKKWSLRRLLYPTTSCLYLDTGVVSQKLMPGVTASRNALITSSVPMAKNAGAFNSTTATHSKKEAIPSAKILT
jgi:hypothetical protein